MQIFQRSWLPIVAVLLTASTDAPAQSNPPITVTADFTTPTGNTAGTYSYSLNVQYGLIPSEMLSGYSTYETNVALMGAGMVRYHQDGQMGMGSPQNPFGWIDLPSTWDQTTIDQALGGSYAYNPVRMINIANWPASMDDGSGHLQPSQYSNYADFCAQLVHILNDAPPNGLGLGIKYFELFNELNGPYTHGNATYNMGTVGQIFNQAAAKMKIVDPTIKVGGPAFSYVEGNTADLADFYSAVGTNLDFVTFHAYGYTSSLQSYSDAQIYDSAACTDTTQVATGLACFGVLKQALLSAGYPSNLEMYLDEFNINGYYNNGTADSRMTTIEGGIFDALVMINEVQTGIAGSLAWNEVDYEQKNAKGDFGKLNANSTQPFTPYPGAYVYDLFNSYMRGPVFKTTTGNAEAVVPFAVKSNGAYAITLVNRSGAEQYVQLKITGPLTLNKNPVFTAYQVGSNGLSAPTTVSYSALTSSAGYPLPADTVTIVRFGSTGMDFNGDGHADILWRNANGTVVNWLMNGGQAIPDGVTDVGGAGTDWQIAGAGDFNGDGQTDILWRNANGGVEIWLMNGGQIMPNGAIYLGAVATDWQIAGVGDFNGDGQADILWRNANGGVEIWLMNGGQIIPNGAIYLGAVATDWQIAGVGDFNGDGQADILWRNANGGVEIWLMNGGQIMPNGAIYLGEVATAWQIAGVGDFNGDGQADILWRNANGGVEIWLMNGGQIMPNGAIYLGEVATAWQIAGVSDFNGDGQADILWRNADGGVEIWLMNGGQIMPEGAIYLGDVATEWTIQQ